MCVMAMTDLIQVVRRKRKRWEHGSSYDEAIKIEGLRPNATRRQGDGIKAHQIAICKMFGHRPHSTDEEDAYRNSNLCRCGSSILHDDAETRLSHVPSCFLFGHTCTKVADRSGHHEFVCNSCGHPLLFEEERPNYVEAKSLKKKQRYLCSVFGHQVHKVADRDGFSEYACHCGHTFLKTENNLSEVKHPLVCLYSGHFVNFLTRRNGFSEYLCRNCGHTFYF